MKYFKTTRQSNVFLILILFSCVLLLAGCTNSNITKNQNPPNTNSGSIESVISSPNVFVDISPTGPTEGEAPLTPSFRYSCSSSDQTPTLCTMTIDGQKLLDAKVPPYPDFDSETWPVFQSVGKHVVEITATNEKGEKTTKRLNYNVNAANPNGAPVAQIWLNKSGGRVPFYPDFTFNCIDPAGKLKSCEIKADNQKTVLLDHPKTIEWPDDVAWDYYREPGTYTITVTATSEDGKTSSKSASFTVTKTIPVYIQPFPSSISTQYKNAIYDAFKYWEGIHDIEFKEVDAPTLDSLNVDWAKEYQGETIGRAEIGGKHVIVGLGDSECNQKYQYYSYDSVVSLTEHELGHSLGYQHTNDTKNIMYPIILNLKYDADVNDELIIPDGWTYYYPSCSRKNQSNYEVKISSDKPVNIYLVPSKSEYEKSLDGNSFNFDSSCYAKGVTNFDKTCSFQSKDYLILINNQRGSNGDAARVNLKLMEQ